MKLGGVVPDSPAAKAALGNGDMIARMNGQPVKTRRDCAEILGKLEPGQRVEVVYTRDGDETKVFVAVEARKRPQPELPTDGELLQLITA